MSVVEKSVEVGRQRKCRRFAQKVRGLQPYLCLYSGQMFMYDKEYYADAYKKTCTIQNCNILAHFPEKDDDTRVNDTRASS